jgi:uncharacterized protein YigE (DUF2233 family)
MRLAWTDAKGAPLRSFSRLRQSLGSEAGKVRFAMNAGMYEQDGGCRDALYLDGAISSLWVPGSGRQDERAPLGPMVVVMDRR